MVITSALHAEGRGFDPHPEYFWRALISKEIEIFCFDHIALKKSEFIKTTVVQFGVAQFACKEDFNHWKLADARNKFYR